MGFETLVSICKKCNGTIIKTGKIISSRCKCNKMENLKELKKELTLTQIDMLISLAELSDRIYEKNKLEEIKNYILNN